MKFIVATCTDNEEIIEVVVSCRCGASIQTLFRKCAEAIGAELYKRNMITPRTTWRYDPPNVWRNGAVGALWFEEPFLNVTIRRKDVEAYIAM